MKRGFTLIELMIAVAIVGILTAIAIPNFAKFQARSKQTEARVNLKAMFTAQRAFTAEKDRFSAFVSEIGFAPERNNRYAYFAGQGGTQEDRSGATPDSAPDNTSVQFYSFRYADRALFDASLINGDPAASPCGLTLPGVHASGGGGGGGGGGDNSGPGNGEGGNAPAGPAVWTGMAQGQIDADSTLDLWSICSGVRKANTSATCDSPGAANSAGEPLVERDDASN
jgi:prepilin-type N-terminal cleavage/methylation domain-containing protein